MDAVCHIDDILKHNILNNSNICIAYSDIINQLLKDTKSEHGNEPETPSEKQGTITCFTTL